MSRDGLEYPIFIRRIYDRGERPRALYLCECGNEFPTDIKSVKIGRTKSCGCLKARNLSKLTRTHGDSLKDSDHNYLYNTWIGVRKRCNNKNDPAYRRYGGRGIKVYELWNISYDDFKLWVLDNIGERPEETSLDRINNDGNYEPGNIRWATQTEQVRNSSSVKLSEEDVREIKLLLSLGIFSNKEIGDEYGVTRYAIYRIKVGDNFKDIEI
jgi:hypothetical protein